MKGILPINAAFVALFLTSCSDNSEIARAQNLEILAENGDAVTMCSLADLYFCGRILPRDFSKAFELYMNASLKEGNPNAQYAIGYMYLNGFGVKRDRAEAVNWFRLSAKGGCKRALRFLDSIAKKEKAERSVQESLIVK